MKTLSKPKNIILFTLFPIVVTSLFLGMKLFTNFDLIQITEIFSNLSFTLFIFGALYTYINKDTIFKDDLKAKQIGHVEELRELTFNFWVDACFLRLEALGILASLKYQKDEYLNIGTYYDKHPEAKEKFSRLRESGIKLFYTLDPNSNLYLRPEWLDKNLYQDSYRSMKELYPYSPSRLGNMEEEVFLAKVSKLSNLINDLDKLLKDKVL